MVSGAPKVDEGGKMDEADLGARRRRGGARDIGTKLTWAKVLAISLLASILRNCTNPSPALLSAREMMVAASASPSARTTAA